MNMSISSIETTISVKQALIDGKNILTGQANNEALLLLQYVTGENKETLIAHPYKLLSDESYQQYCGCLQRRAQGEPLAYIVGAKEFWSLSLKVVPGVLIPRPETELLVETALDLISKDYCTTILDLGTGSGCIALALASECPNSHIIACDNSKTCINTAKQNAANLNIKNITFIASNWFEAIQAQRFDLIISNPPYISTKDPNLQDQVRQHEPHQALISDQDGFADIQHIIQQAPSYLNKNGQLLLEHGWQQGRRVRELFTNNNFTKIKTLNDLQQHERITLGSY